MTYSVSQFLSASFLLHFCHFVVYLSLKVGWKGDCRRPIPKFSSFAFGPLSLSLSRSFLFAGAILCPVVYQRIYRVPRTGDGVRSKKRERERRGYRTKFEGEKAVDWGETVSELLIVACSRHTSAHIQPTSPA